MEYKCQVHSHKKVMVYCKPYDSDVIVSFYTLFKHIAETYENLSIYTDDWAIEEIEKGKDGSRMHNGKELLHFKN